MCKFASEDEQKYKPVWKAVKNMVEYLCMCLSWRLWSLIPLCAPFSFRPSLVPETAASMVGPRGVHGYLWFELVSGGGDWV